jgi:hypothetical protein
MFAEYADVVVRSRSAEEFVIWESTSSREPACFAGRRQEASPALDPRRARRIPFIGLHRTSDFAIRSNFLVPVRCDHPSETRAALLGRSSYGSIASGLRSDLVDKGSLLARRGRRVEGVGLSGGARRRWIG